MTDPVEEPAEEGANEEDGSGSRRLFLWRGDLTKERLRGLLLVPWHRWRLNLQAVGRRLSQPPKENTGPLVPAPLVLLLLAALVATLSFFPLDARISRAMEHEPEGVVAFLTYATDVGLVRWYIYPAVALILLLSSMDWSSRSRFDRLHISNVYGHTAFLFASVAAAGICTQILKALFGRARPELLDVHGSFGFGPMRLAHEFSSFPSGHSTTIGAVTVVMAVWFPALRLPLIAAGACFAMTRIVVRAHYPSDVVAGLTIGMATALLLARFLAQRRLLYAFQREGRGLMGLIPLRSDRVRDIDKQGIKRVRRRLSRERPSAPAPQSRAPDRP